MSSFSPDLDQNGVSPMQVVASANGNLEVAKSANQHHVWTTSNPSSATETMDQRLFKAARLGDTSELGILLEEDPLILEKLCLSPTAENPLHIAAHGGKTDFARELIRRMPSFARELNHDGFSPMHMASDRGHIEIVRELLAVGRDLCLVKDKGGRTPLHYAAVRGRIDVIEELLSHCPAAIEVVTAQHETALHLAVKYNQFKALSVLVDWLENMDNLCKEVIKVKDVEDNTLLKLAISAKQYQVLDLLRDKGGLLGMVQGELLELLQVNAAADLESQQIVEVLGGGQSVDGIDTMLQEPRTDVGNLNNDRKQWQQPDQSTKNEPDNKSGNIQNATLVVASVIATVTFQAGLTPPPTIWRQDMNLDPKCIFQKSKNDTSIRSSFLTPINSCPALAFYSFMSFNTAAFISSVFLLIVSSQSLGGPKATDVLLVPIFCMIASYLALVIAISPTGLSFIIIYGVTLCILLYFAITLGLARKLSARLRRGRIKAPREEDGAL